MKKRSLIFAILALSFLPVSCTGNIDGSSVVSENITGIIISSPNSVDVGKSITLGIDVEGSEDDAAVTIAVSDSSVAKIEGLKLTGLKEGSVTVTVTSTRKPDIKATKDVNVVAPNSKNISLEVFDNDNVTYDATTNYYTVPMGQKFKIRYVLTPGTSDKFQSVSYSVVYPSSNPDGMFNLTQNQDNTATVQALNSYDSISVVIKAFYNTNTTTPDLQTSIQFHVIDANKDNKAKFEEIVSKFDESKLNESKRTVSLTKSDGTKTTEEKSIFTQKSYTDHTLIDEEKTTDGANPTATHYYSSVYKDKYYVFSYLSETKAIQNIFANEAGKDKDGSSYFDVSTGNVISGYKGLIDSYFSSSSKGDVVLFGSGYLYSYSTFEFGTNSITVNSSYTDDNSNSYEARFVMNYEDTKFTGFTFTETIHKGGNTITYSDVVEGLKYDGKGNETNPVIDMTKYFFTEENYQTEVATDKDKDGKYDFSDPDKYFHGIPSKADDGIDLYEIKNTQTLALRIKRKGDSIATTAIDTFTMDSSDKTIIAPSSMLANSNSSDGSGIFTITPFKATDGSIKEGQTLITLASTSGVIIKFYVKVTKVELSAIKVSGTTIDDDSNKTSLGEIYVGRYSNTFEINGTPDDSNAFVWKLSDVTGGDGGIELYHYPDGNIDGLHGYAIKAIKAGSYTFKIGAESSNVTTTNTYSIVVKEAISNDELKKNLIDSKNTYVYKTGSYSFTLAFTDEKQITFTQKISYDNSSVVSKINYRFDNGRIVVDEQVLTTGSYFSYVKGDFQYDDKFDSIKAYLVIKDDSTSLNYQSYTFNKYVDKSNPTTYLPEKTFKVQQNYNLGSGYANYNNTLVFDDKNGATLTIANAKSGDTVATITFSYTYDANGHSLVISDVKSSDSKIGISDLNPYWDGTSLTIKLSVEGQSSYLAPQIKFSI